MDLTLGLGNLIGGAVQGITGYFANKNTNKTNLQIARETNEANKALAEYSYEKNLEQWNRENEYNSPTAQMARLKEAGLNPNLIYGNGQAVRPSANSPQYNAPEMKAAHMQPWSGSDFGITNSVNSYIAGKQKAAELGKTIQETSNLGAQEDYTRALVEKAYLDTANAAIKNARDQFDLDQAKVLYDSVVATAQKGVEKLQSDIDLNQKVIEEKQANINYLEEKTNWTRQDAIRVNRTIDHISSSISLNNALTRQADSVANLNKAKQKGQELSNDLAESTLEDQKKIVKQKLTNLSIEASNKNWNTRKIMTEFVANLKSAGYKGDYGTLHALAYDLASTITGVPLPEEQMNSWLKALPEE